jgi:hypothetical protein
MTHQTIGINIPPLVHEVKSAVSTVENSYPSISSISSITPNSSGSIFNENKILIISCTLIVLIVIVIFVVYYLSNREPNLSKLLAPTNIRRSDNSGTANKHSANQNHQTNNITTKIQSEEDKLKKENEDELAKLKIIEASKQPISEPKTDIKDNQQSLIPTGSIASTTAETATNNLSSAVTSDPVKELREHQDKEIANKA